MIEAVVVLAVLIAIILFMFTDLRAVRRGRKTDEKSLGVMSAFAAGVVALSAVISVAGSAVDGTVVVMPFAAGVAAAAALTVHATLRPVTNWLFGSLGAIAAGKAIVEMALGRTCYPGSGGQAELIATTVVSLLVCATAFFLAFVLTRSQWGAWAKGLAPLTGLGIFGVLELLAFLRAPVGVAILPQDGIWRWVSLIGLSAALAALAGVRPELVLGLTAISILVAQILLELGNLEGCAEGSLFAVTIPALVVYVIVFAVLRMVVARITAGRVTS